jgi:hypothetical protein
MAVTFDLGDGVSCQIQDDAQLVQTQRGKIRADLVQQGDRIKNLSGEPMREVVAPPVVS